MSFNPNYNFYRTAESVSPRHPDKLCDQISDAILDEFLRRDPNSRVAVETCGGHGKIFITGEISSIAEDVDFEKIAKRIAGKNNKIITNIVQQSSEIARGVDNGGAGDQGIMIGYATNETPEFLPLEVVLSRRLNQYIFQRFPFDGKTQITLKPNGEVDSIVASFQNVAHEKLSSAVWNFIQINHLGDNIKVYINPAGDWNQGGFDADTGLTGRKLIIDNYGPRIPIGGGCFSGKDPSKVDRSAAYMARRIAVDYLKERNANEVFVRLAYAIGEAEPLEKTIVIDGKSEIIKGYDLTPNGIIKFLGMKRPIYEETAKYGHFGEGFCWDCL